MFTYLPEKSFVKLVLIEFEILKHYMHLFRNLWFLYAIEWPHQVSLSYAWLLSFCCFELSEYPKALAWKVAHPYFLSFCPRSLQVSPSLTFSQHHLSAELVLAGWFFPVMEWFLPFPSVQPSVFHCLHCENHGHGFCYVECWSLSHAGWWISLIGFISSYRKNSVLGEIEPKLTIALYSKQRSFYRYTWRFRVTRKQIIQDL